MQNAADYFTFEIARCVNGFVIVARLADGRAKLGGQVFKHRALARGRIAQIKTKLARG